MASSCSASTKRGPCLEMLLQETEVGPRSHSQCAGAAEDPVMKRDSGLQPPSPTFLKKSIHTQSKIMLVWD